MTATFDDGDVIRARYVVGADGIHSTVREQAGIGFHGGAYDESFILADVHLSGEAPVEEVVLFWATAGLTVVAPLPDGSLPHRRAGRRRARGHRRPSSCSRCSTNAGSAQDRMVVTDVVWGSRFRIHHRVADTYRAGRLLLAGDAAHVHSPAGGQGMNLGIQDAVALADALASRPCRWPGHPARRVQRRRAARSPPDVVALTDRLTRLATLPRGPAPLPQRRDRPGRTGARRSPGAGHAAQRARLPLRRPIASPAGGQQFGDYRGRLPGHRGRRHRDGVRRHPRQRDRGDRRRRRPQPPTRRALDHRLPLRAAAPTVGLLRRELAAARQRHASTAPG